MREHNVAGLVHTVSEVYFVAVVIVVGRVYFSGHRARLQVEHRAQFRVLGGDHDTEQVVRLYEQAGISMLNFDFIGLIVNLVLNKYL